jgi:hypothetical protein
MYIYIYSYMYSYVFMCIYADITILFMHIVLAYLNVHKYKAHTLINEKQIK